MRDNWDEYFINLADAVATRSTCERLSVGAVIVDADTHTIISTGYNGSVHGLDHCEDEGCLLNDEGRCIRTIHAEVNAVLHANPMALTNPVAYVTYTPCEQCVKILAQSGIRKVVYKHDYANKYNHHFTKHMQMIHHQ